MNKVAIYHFTDKSEKRPIVNEKQMSLLRDFASEYGTVEKEYLDKNALASSPVMAVVAGKILSRIAPCSIRRRVLAFRSASVFRFRRIFWRFSNWRISVFTFSCWFFSLSISGICSHLLSGGKKDSRFRLPRIIKNLLLLFLHEVIPFPLCCLYSLIIAFYIPI